MLVTEEDYLALLNAGRTEQANELTDKEIERLKNKRGEYMAKLATFAYDHKNILKLHAWVTKTVAAHWCHGLPNDDMREFIRGLRKRLAIGEDQERDQARKSYLKHLQSINSYTRS